MRRQLDAGLHLLDRQLLDAEGNPAGKVDDLEITLSPDGRRAFVTAILSGPIAFAPRLGGRLSWWVFAIARRLREGDETPHRVPIEDVDRIDAAVSLRRRAQTPAGLEGWLRNYFIGRIPGSGHASR